MSTVKQGEFPETLITHHPGVTTMWLAGLRTFFMEPRVDVKNLARARLFIGIAVWAGLCVAALLLYKLFGQWIALMSFACLATSPLFLAQTRRVHTDALAATFILLTVLLFLLYCQNRQHRRYLVFSGIAFGLALLSKSYALILLPWIPFCLVLCRNSNQKSAGFKRIIVTLLCILSCSLLTVILGWPVFWKPTFAVLAVCLFGGIYTLSEALRKETISVKSLSFLAASLVFSVTGFSVLQTVWTVLNEAGKAIITPHEVEHFFLGKVVNDPGWLFYPFVLTIKSTPLMLPLALVACLLLWKQRKDSAETARQFRLALVLVAGVVLFTVCLSATSKKFSRYLLPAFPLLEILAAIGFVAGLKWSYVSLQKYFGHGVTTKYKTALAVSVCSGFFFIQIWPVFALHPYYGTYYNLCWKVTDLTKILTVGDASGLDIAAKYLNQTPNAHRMQVQVSPLATQIIRHYFDGHAYSARRTIEHRPNYEIVYIRDSQIGRARQTGTLNGDLEAVITLNGMEHVWIYRIAPPEE